jgi:hypothetical protein
LAVVTGALERPFLPPVLAERVLPEAGCEVARRVDAVFAAAVVA